MKSPSKPRSNPKSQRPSARESLRDEFLRLCADIREGTLRETRASTARDKLDLMMFSILVLMDGFDGSGGPYPLMALGGSRHLTQISGDLHDHWYRFKHRMPAVPENPERPRIPPMGGTDKQTWTAPDITLSRREREG